MKITRLSSLSFYLSLFLYACSSPSRETATTANIDTMPKMEVMIPAQTCYAGTIARDSIFLKVEKFPNVVTGTLELRYYEKDQSIGAIEGKMHGDTLIADYTYFSEGTTSIRQVALLLQNDMAYQGHGEMTEKDGKMVFTNLSEIKFDTSLKLTKTACH